MAGVNKAILVGHVGRDPELRATQDGRAVATFSLATSETWRDKATGERREKTEWHHVVVFNDGLVKVVEQYVKKGSKLYLCGAIKTRKYTDQQGIERARTEIVLSAFGAELALLDRAERAPPPEEEAYGAGGAGAAGSAPAGEKPSRAQALDDDIPF